MLVYFLSVFIIFISARFSTMSRQSSRQFLRKTLLTSVFAGLLSGGVLMAHNAQAGAPELYFHPTKAWNVIQRDEGCIAQNEFNNGFVLSFSGTTQWVNALDVNFRQNAFKQGDAYKVSISVPGLASTTVRAPAVSGDTIRIDLKSHKELYKKMRLSGVVDMTIEGNDFRFYLTGFTNSAIQFERCMSGGAIRHATSSDDALIAKVPQDKPLVASAQKLTNTDMENYMTNEAMALEAQTKAQTASAVEAPRQRLSEKLATEINNNPESIAMDRGAPSSAVVAAEDTLDIPDADILQPVAPVKVMEASPEVMLPEPVETRKPEAELKAVIDEEVSWNAEPPAPPKEVSELTAVSVDNVPAKVVHKQSPKMKVTTENSYAEADFRNVGHEKAHVPVTRTESNSVLLDKISGLEAKLGLMASENIALTQDLKQSLRAAEKEKLSISSENWNLEQATMQFNEAERQIKRLGIQLQS
jgi:hypothetical protein